MVVFPYINQHILRQSHMTIFNRVQFCGGGKHKGSS